VAGVNLVAGAYTNETARTGTVLELAVQGSPVGGFRPRRPPPGGGPPPPPQPGPPIADQEPAHVAAAWPVDTDVRLAPAMLQAQQKWTLAPVANAGGYPGAPYFRISVTGTERALTAIEGGELVARPFKGEPAQLWRIDQLTDGSYRIMPKAIPGTPDPLALSAVGSSMPTLARFDPASDRQRWHIGAP
jgi:arabinan endo-1,5-alpha-L-arabinosidase